MAYKQFSTSTATAGYVPQVSSGNITWTNPNALFDVTSWTPVLAFGGASVGITYVTQGGVYVVNNGIAFVRCSIELSSKGSSTGSMTITGLPADVSSPISQSVSIRFGNLTFTGQVGARVATQTMYVEQTASTGSPTSLADTNFANNSFVTLVGTWQI